MIVLVNLQDCWFKPFKISATGDLWRFSFHAKKEYLTDLRSVDEDIVSIFVWSESCLNPRFQDGRYHEAREGGKFGL